MTEPKRLYAYGVIGDVPDGVSPTFDHAVREVLEMHVGFFNGDTPGNVYDLAWTCRVIHEGARPWFRWLHTTERGQTLYIERLEVEDEDDYA